MSKETETNKPENETQPDTGPEQTPVDDGNQSADLARLQDMANEGEGASEQPPQNIPTAQIVAPLVDMLFSLFAPSWDVSKGEKETLSDAYAAVIDKYFPGGVALGPELGAVLVTAAIIMPRMNTPRKPEPKPEPGPGDEK